MTDYQDLEYWRDTVTKLSEKILEIQEALVLQDDPVTETRLANETITEIGEHDHVQFLSESEILGLFNKLGKIKFVTDYENDTPVEGELWWNSADDTLNLMGPNGQNTQIGQEITVPVFNNTGSQIDDGDVVYLSGGNSRPFVTLADADNIVTAEALGIATHDIGIAANGKVTVLGLIRGLDTSGTNVNDPVYLSSTAGEWTTTRPTFPAWTVKLGKIEVVSATVGVILMLPIVMENIAVFFGSVNENFDFTVSETGGTVTGSLQKAGGGNVHVFWPSGIEILVTAPLTIDLTANVGTDTVPKIVYVYLDGTTKTIAQNTTGWPTASHVKIAMLELWSATQTGVDGPRVNQNWNNYSANVTDLRGRIELLSEKVRRLGATYFSGIGPNGATTSYFTLTTADGFFLSLIGKAYQMHLHTVPAITMSTVPGDPCFVINNATTPDKRITDLYSIQTLADGTTGLTNNQYFNLVFAIIINKSGSHLVVLLPSGEYAFNAKGLAAAKRDDNKYSSFDLGRSLTIDSSTGIFVGRATFQFKTLGTAWVFHQFESLLGKDPTIAGGAGLGYTDVDAISAVEEAGLTLATTKAILSQDEDLVFTFGRMRFDSRFSDHAVASHRDRTGTGDYAILQLTNGLTNVNSSAGQPLQFLINNSAKARLASDGSFLIARASSSADIFEVTGDAGKTAGGTAWNAICDLLTKDIIGDYNLGLDILIQITPKKFRRKAIFGLGASTRDEVNIVSQDLELIAPSMIEERIERYKHKDHTDEKPLPLLEQPLKWFVGADEHRWMMHNSIKELKLKNDELENRLTALEAKSI